MSDSEWSDEKSDIKPFAKSPKRKAQGKAGSASNSPSKKSKSAVDDKDKKTGPWSAEEDAVLFRNTYVKKPTIAWQGIAEQIPGRDAKSCQNRMVVLQRKVRSIFG